MPSEIEKICPILHTSRTDEFSKCKGSKCAFWCDFANCCSVQLIAGILADSDVNKDVFMPDGKAFLDFLNTEENSDGE